VRGGYQHTNHLVLVQGAQRVRAAGRCAFIAKAILTRRQHLPAETLDALFEPGQFRKLIIKFALFIGCLLFEPSQFICLSLLLGCALLLLVKPDPLFDVRHLRRFDVAVGWMPVMVRSFHENCVGNEPS
jgi:hypothetical protein